MNNQSLAKKFSVTTLAAAVSVLSACSSPSDPDGGSNTAKYSVQGSVVDAYLAGATVYVDTNNNGKRDSWEAKAITDRDGFYTTSKDGNTDYCAADATELEQVHCLRTTVTGNAVIRAFGGFDIFTSEPFLGSLSSDVTVLADGTVPNQVISPLTSIVQGLSTSEADTIKTNLGLNGEDFETDFLGEGVGSFDADLTNAALKLHKVVSLFANVFDDHFEAFGEEAGFPFSSSKLVYEALSAKLQETGTLDNTELTDVFSTVNAAVLGLYNDLDDEDVSFPGNASDATVIQDALDILGLIDSAVPSGTADLAEARNRMVGVETVLAKMNNDDSDISNAISVIGNLASDFYTALNGAEVDFASLLDLDFTTAGASEFSGAAIGSGGDVFTNLGDRALYLDYDDDEDGISGQVLITFDEDESGTAGTLELCLYYDDSNTTGDDEDIYETDGSLLDIATWFTINDRRMILTLEGALDIALVSLGLNDDSENVYSMSYGGETAKWSSDDGLLDLDTIDFTIPTDNESCAEVLAGIRNGSITI